MKKLFRFLRSMRFGILLLFLIALCSVLGSLIPQEREVAWYAQTYPDLHGMILMLGLRDVFHSWYFLTLLGLLCVNLTLCSLLRVGTLLRAGDPAAAAARLPNSVRLDGEGQALLSRHMAELRCRELRFGDVRVYRKNALGSWGAFLTHLSILLTVLLGAAALYLPRVTDETCFPGDFLLMEDGTRIQVNAFSIENESGQLDFASEIAVTLPDGRQSGAHTIRVNHPLSFGPYKVYQQTYGTAGSVTVRNLESGGEDSFTLTDMCFLSLDSVNGLWYEALYPDYLRDPEGNVTLVASTAGRYAHPVYQALLASEGVYTPVLVFPGESVQVGTLEFTFNEPVEYPGLRVKRTPGAVNALLCAAFALMIAGLYITFFLQPVLVKADAEGYAVAGPKPEGMRMELDALCRDHIIQQEESS